METISSVSCPFYCAGSTPSTLYEVDLSDVWQEGTLPSNLVKGMIYNKALTKLITNMKGLDTCKLSNQIEALRLLNPALSFNLENFGETKTLYIRSFYSFLYNTVLKCGKSVLTGNPGISKSWFQLYMLYRFVNDKPVDIVIRDDGGRVTLIDLQRSQAFSTMYTMEGLELLYYLKPEKAFYLMEPQSLIHEPQRTRVRTLISAPPDIRRFKEFVKNGATKLYMPVWTLEELLTVGADIRAQVKDDGVKDLLTPENIVNRYKRFGGIFRYVLPENANTVLQAELAQDIALHHTKPLDVYVPGGNIEKVDEMKENVSHLVLQYDVFKSEPTDGRTPFTSFRMRYASAYVQDNLWNRITDQQMLESIERLRLMFRGGETINSLLFEDVVFNLFTRVKNCTWTICDSDVKFEFDIKRGEVVARHDEKKVLQAVEPGCLYRSVNKRFPICDMLWKDSKLGWCCIQVTFDKNHSKEPRTYESLFEILKLDPKKDKLNVYFVPQPQHVKEYSRKDKTFIEGGNHQMKNMKFSCITTKAFVERMELEFVS